MSEPSVTIPKLLPGTILNSFGVVSSEDEDDDEEDSLEEGDSLEDGDSLEAGDAIDEGDSLEAGDAFEVERGDDVPAAGVIAVDGAPASEPPFFAHPQITGFKSSMQRMHIMA
jgi:hypothetical protein